MEPEAISISEDILRALIDIKRPAETLLDLIGRLVAERAKHVERQEGLARLLRLYLPEATIAEFLTSKDLLHGENRTLAVMFTDIRSFTKISETASPEEMIIFLNDYFRLMTDIIYTKGGVVDKYIGDAIMAYFGYPTYEEGIALETVLAAMEMIDATKKDLHGYSIGIGINLGIVTIGNVGHPERKLNFTIIGDMVNLASRLEGLTKAYGQDILVSESIYDKVRGVLPCRWVDTVSVKGKGAANIYTAGRDLNKKELAAWEKHNVGMGHLSALKFEPALECFQEVLQYHENDHLAKLMIERCRQNLGKPLQN